METIAEQVNKTEEDILLAAKPDRRLLSKVPDKEELRTNVDRRRLTGRQEEKNDFTSRIKAENLGRRYLVNYEVAIIYVLGRKKSNAPGKEWIFRQAGCCWRFLTQWRRI